MNITIKGTNLSLTDALRDLVEQKILDSLRALGGMNKESVRVAVELERTTHRYIQSKHNEQLYRAEATVSLPGHTLRVEESAKDIEQAIIKLKHTLTRDIRKWREHLIHSRRQGARKAKSLPVDIDPQQVMEDMEALADVWIEEKEAGKQEQVAEEISGDEWEDDEVDERDLI